MKKRLLSFALAVTMLFGSFNIAYADETIVAETDIVTADDVTVVDDDVESGESVDVTLDDTDETTAYWETTSPWQATVFGDCGGQDRVDGFYADEDSQTTANGWYDGVYTYDVSENGSDVTIRMGVPNYSDSSSSVATNGKISSTSDGIVFYYQEVSSDEDFTLSATAHVNGILNTNSQVSFGATVRDVVDPYVASDTSGTYANGYGNAISAAILDMNNASAGTMKFAYYRTAGTGETLVKNSDKISNVSSLTEAPDVGDEFEISITKVGDNYTLKFGDDVTLFNAADLEITFDDTVYVGFFAARCADITFSNVSYSNGEAVEVGDWTSGGNGLVGNDDKIGYVVVDAQNDNSDITLTIDTVANGEPLGKLSDSEDSYAYYAAEAPADEDFTLTGTINSIDLAPNYPGSSSSPQQAFVGFVIFNNTYTKNEGYSLGDQIFVGLKSKNSSASNADLIYKISKDGSYTSEILKSDVVSVGGTLEGPIDFKLQRSGDILTVTWGDNTYSITGVSEVFTDSQYIGYAVARDGAISVSDNALTVGSKSVKSVEIETMPEKTEYYATQSFDSTGLSFRVTYSDGTEEIITDSSEYALLGFDNSSTQSFNSIGDKVVQASIGGIICEIPITVRAMKVISISVDYTPIYNTFYVGGKFNFVGLQVTATFEDGTSSVLDSDEYILSIGDTVIEEGVTTITEDMVSPDVAITVTYTDTDEAIDPAGETGVFYVAIDPGVLTGLQIATYSYTTTFYVGQEYVQTGLTVKGVYTNGDTTTTQIISSDLYEVVGFDSSTVHESLTLTIQLIDDPSIYTTYTISVLEATPYSVTISTYPRLTYSQNEAFDGSGLTIGLTYTDLNVYSIDGDAMYYKNGTEYYKVYEYNVYDDDGNTLYSRGDTVTVTEDELNEADFYYDITDYDSSEVGTTQVLIYISDEYENVSDYPVELDITITESTDYVWKAMLFGASVFGTGNDKEPSSITVNYADGTTGYANDDGTTITPSLMEDGTLSDVDSVRLRSWDGSGKITGDMDGIAYYYTSVDGSNNFTLSADITVNTYVADPDNFTTTQQAQYDSYIAQGLSSSEAIDRMRTGQEAFGIIARDIIPFAGGMVDGEYTGDSNSITNIASEALHDDYTFTKSDGTTVTYNLPVDAYESYANNITVIDEDGNSHVSVAGADNASNVVIAGATTDGTFPSNTSSSSYYSKSTMNRITLMARYNSSRIGYYGTTDKMPEKGEKYNVTLTKTNTGFMITTYDYQNDTINSQFMYDSVEDMENVLTSQDSDNIYVGFFAARWADITVENIELYETDTTTDPNYTGTSTTTVDPTITMSSAAYTTSTDYNLELRSNSSDGVLGGLTTVSMNGKTVASEIVVGNTKVRIPVELEADYKNQFSVVYYPNTADTGFTNYDPVIIRFTVTHKSKDSIADLSNIYVAPNGSLSGDGTRNNPLTLEVAVALVDYGGTVTMLDGTYNLTNEYAGEFEFTSSMSGLANGYYKSLVADDGASPVIDLEKEYAGFSVDADYWYFKGFSVINAKDNENGFVLGGDHCVVENCTFANNGDTGFQLSRINSSDALIYFWPSYNLIKSCESYNNCDPSMNNADGFAAKLTVGYGNVFQDCISHHNLDDGWDLYTKQETGAIGAVILENCITYRNGYQLDETTGTDALYDDYEGNGFKLGGESIYVEHMLKDCVSFENMGSGVTSNNNPAMIIRNVISYNNNSYNFNLKSGSTTVLTDSEGNTRDADGRSYKFNYDIKGAVSVASTDSIGSWNSDTTFGNISENPIESEVNYFIDDTNTPSNQAVSTLVGVNSLGETIDPSTFFVSTDSSTSLTNLRYSRNEDGSFNHGDFLARTVAYEHDAEDIVTVPDVYGGEGGVGLGVTTEATTTEVTTTSSSSSSKKSSGAGGGGSVKNYTTTTTTTEATTEGTTTDSEEATEATTETVVFTDSVSIQIGSNSITVNDNVYTMDVAPYIQTSSNSTMVPLRFVAIALAGGNVDDADSSDLIIWDAATKTATISAGSNTIVFTAGSRTYVVNGNTYYISNQAVAEIVDGRMFVPFRTIGEALGASVSWDADTKTAMYN